MPKEEGCLEEKKKKQNLNIGMFKIVNNKAFTVSAINVNFRSYKTSFREEKYGIWI